MFCDECKEKPATVHITKIINNQKMELNLCENCAKAYQPPWGFGIQPFSIHKFLAGLMDMDTTGEETVEYPAKDQPRCEQCGLTYTQFGQTGRLGCNKCYDYFQDRLQPLLRRIHGTSRHTGKVPQRSGALLRVRKDLEKLRINLKQLIAGEEFEKAAKVRDQIREIEKRLK
ncbi:MAG: UvrB/UvrC motif-containing protein [Bacillota bacterium]